jgi:hypothetical protein
VYPTSPDLDAIVRHSRRGGRPLRTRSKAVIIALVLKVLAISRGLYGFHDTGIRFTRQYYSQNQTSPWRILALRSDEAEWLQQHGLSGFTAPTLRELVAVLRECDVLDAMPRTDPLPRLRWKDGRYCSGDRRVTVVPAHTPERRQWRMTRHECGHETTYVSLFALRVRLRDGIACSECLHADHVQA